MAQAGMAMQERKRPWYVALALSVALALGMMGAYGGCATFTLYRAPNVALAMGVAATRDIADDADRAAVQTRFDAFVATLDAAKPRGWPLAVATLLLGGAIVVFATRTIAGSRSGRVALLQLVVAQAGLTAASAWLMRDVDDADMRFRRAFQSALVHESTPERREADRWLFEHVSNAWNPVVLALRTLGSAFVLVALTRRRARHFFDAAGAAVEER
jgi:hypothetical protein